MTDSDFKANILVVDDTPANLRLLSQMLTDCGYKVRPVPSGELAIKAAKAAPPDLILLDVNMPDMDGYAVCEKLKEDPAYHNVPVIFISALDETADKVKAFSVGGVDYITKPFQFEEVLARVETHLSLRSLRAKLQEMNAELEERVTELARSKEALRESEKRYRTLVETSPDAIFLIDIEGIIRFCNLHAVDMFGVDSTLDLVDLSFFDLVVENDRERIREDARKIWKSEGTYWGQYLFLRRDGIGKLTGEINISVVPDELGQSVCYIGVVRDITDRRQMEEALLASQKLAGLGTMAAGVAHEINSPLQVVTGVSKRLLTNLQAGEAEEDRVIRDVEIISRNSWRVAEIVRSLLTYARYSSEQYELEDINAIVHDGLILAENQFSDRTDIELVIEFGEDIPGFYCDRNRIIQTLINLVSNAGDAMPVGGKITITTGYDKETRQIMLQVTDEGEGIPEEIKEKIFDPFFTTKPVGGGTGLGLSIVIGIVQGHGGQIAIDSRSGKGSTFTLYFPERPPKRVEDQLRTEIFGRFSDNRIE